jgi:hypothetical protein
MERALRRVLSRPFVGGEFKTSPLLRRYVVPDDLQIKFPRHGIGPRHHVSLAAMGGGRLGVRVLSITIKAGVIYRPVNLEMSRYSSSC